MGIALRLARQCQDNGPESVWVIVSTLKFGQIMVDTALVSEHPGGDYQKVFIKKK